MARYTVEIPESSSSGQGPHWHTAYPAMMMVAVVILALMLIVQVVLRPWAGPDWSREASFNFRPLDDDYGRTLVALVDATPAPLLGWTPRHDIDYSVAAAGEIYYVAYARAGCHGFDGEGLPAGPGVTGLSERRIVTLTRKGPGNMPGYEADWLPDLEMLILAQHMEQMPVIEPPIPTPAVPTATPWPSPTPFPTPTPAPTATLAPGQTPVVEPTPTPTPAPAPGADPAVIARGQRLYVDVGCDLCHGRSGEGNEDGPPVTGLSAERLFDYTRAPTEPVPKWPPMDAYGPGDISDTELDAIVAFLFSLTAQ